MEQPKTDAGERFVVGALAGSGGMGAVYHALDRETGLPVALKFLRGAGLVHADRFEREAELLALLRHSAIVRYVAHGWAPSGEPWLAMEWLDGEDLGARLRRGYLDRTEALALGRRVGDALAAAHAAGVVHRDIKPSNLHLPGGRMEDVVLIDFGVARVQTEPWTAPGVAIGTPWYMAPEQARGEVDVDARADVFSLGCVMFECLAGRVPFPGEHLMAVLAKIILGEAPRLRELRPAIDAPVDGLIAAMLAKDKARRPADGAAVVVAIDDLEPAPQSGGDATLAAPAPIEVLGSVDQIIVNVVAARAVHGGDDDGAPITLRGGRVRARVDDVAHAYGGRVEWLADGSVVLVLSGPGSATDRAALAARCALALRELLPRAPMVLATGRGVVGSERTAGEAIDRAASMLRAARNQDAGRAAGGPLGVLVDEATEGLLPARFVVAGTAPGAALFGVAEGRGAARTLQGRRTPHVGRDRELRMLGDLFDDCVREGEPMAAVVSGVAGSGKSRLLDELWRRLDARSDAPERWIAVGDPLTAGVPLAMLRPALRHALGLRAPAPETHAADLTRRVAERVGEADVARVTAFVGELLGVDLPDQDRPGLAAARRDPVLMGDQVRRAVIDLTRAECSRRPLAIVLEDLHWGDKETVALIGAAMRELSALPLFVIAATRAEEEDRSLRASWTGLPVTELALGRLSRRASVELVRAVLGEAAPDEVVARISERGDEGPLYLEELLRAELEGRGDAPPATLLAMIHTRLAALEEAERRVLRAAAVFGRSFGAGGVAALSGLDEQDAGQVLERLAQRELVLASSAHAGDGGFAFRHALVRDAAYGMLTDDDRTLGHRLAAAWLERAGERDAAVLAEHFERGGDQQRAAHWYGRASADALERNGFDAAIQAAERAIACGAAGEALGELYLVMADAHVWKGDFAASESRARLALTELPRGSPRWFDAAARFTGAAEKLGHVDAAASVVEELCDVDPREDAEPAFAAAAATMATHLLTAGRAELAGRLLDRITSCIPAMEALSSGAAAQVHLARAVRAHFTSDPGAAMVELERALRAFRDAGDLRHACPVAANLGYIAAELGDYERAERHLEQAVEAARLLGTPNAAAYAKHNLGLVLARRGLLDDAARTELDALALAVVHHDPRLEAGCRMYLARIALLRDRLDDARTEVQHALALAPDGAPIRADVLSTWAAVELRSGRAEEALRVATEAAELGAGGHAEADLYGRMVHAEACWATGDRVAARSVLADARRSLLERAGKIQDASLRRMFLENVPENARIVALTEAWDGGEVGGEVGSARR